MKLLVTGGAGFIGSALVRHVIAATTHEVVNIDCLTYAGHLSTLAGAADSPRYAFERIDVRDAVAVRTAFERHQPDSVIHLAAESHVDRSIDGPGDFVTTNVVGTYTMLEESRRYRAGLQGQRAEAFRFLHVSTDEVFGSLGDEGRFTERTSYDPSSPYSATKAASDHLARAWHRTYGLPVIVTNCSNNYGPFQFPEKLIPLMIENGLAGRRLPVYGAGRNVRDWLFVDDHVRALMSVISMGRPGETYNIGGRCERQNLEVVRAICALLDEAVPTASPRHSLIEFVTDRPGHDLRYAIDASKIEMELGWSPVETFESGLRKTVRWYLDNRDWCRSVAADRAAARRIGLGRQAA